MKNKKELRKNIKKLAENSPLYPVSNGVERLVKIGREAVEPLIEILNKSEGYTSINAAYALGLIGDKRVVKPLLNALSNYPYKLHYIYALKKLRAYEAIDELKKYLDLPETNWAAASALFEFGEKELSLKYILEDIKPFNTFFNKPQGLESRASAAYFCAEHKIKEAVEILFDSIVDLHSYGIESLAFIGGEGTVEKAKQMALLSDVRGLYATYLMGLLKDDSLIEKFIDMTENFDKYIEKYSIDVKTMEGWSFVLGILGNYSNDIAKINFFKNINKQSLGEQRIGHFLFEYYEYYQCLRTYGICSRHKLKRDIIINHGWDKYLKNELYCKAFAGEFVPDKWDIENGTVEYRKKLKNEVIENITKDIASKLKEYKK